MKKKAAPNITIKTKLRKYKAGTSDHDIDTGKAKPKQEIIKERVKIGNAR